MATGLALQQTVYQLLNSDPQLKAKISGVYDGFPKHTNFPFITLGDSNSNPFVTFGHLGEELYMTIHVWSRYKGYKEGLQIVADIQRLLGQQNIYVSGFGTVGSFFDSSDTLREEDGITRHLMLRYRFIIQH